MLEIDDTVSIRSHSLHMNMCFFFDDEIFPIDIHSSFNSISRLSCRNECSYVSVNSKSEFKLIYAILF